MSDMKNHKTLYMAGKLELAHIFDRCMLPLDLYDIFITWSVDFLSSAFHFTCLRILEIWDCSLHLSRVTGFQSYLQCIIIY